MWGVPREVGGAWGRRAGRCVPRGDVWVPLSLSLPHMGASSLSAAYPSGTVVGRVTSVRELGREMAPVPVGGILAATGGGGQPCGQHLGLCAQTEVKVGALVPGHLKPKESPHPHL